MVCEIYRLDGPEAVGAFGLSAIRIDEIGKAELVPALYSDQLLAHGMEHATASSAPGRS